MFSGQNTFSFETSYDDDVDDDEGEEEEKEEGEEEEEEEEEEGGGGGGEEGQTSPAPASISISCSNSLLNSKFSDGCELQSPPPEISEGTFGEFEVEEGSSGPLLSLFFLGVGPLFVACTGIHS